MQTLTKHNSAHYFPLLLSILFIGTSGPLGRLVHISPVALICFRSIIAFIILFLLLKLTGKEIIITNKKTRNFILLSGLFLTLHWTSYFFALQLSSVALGMLSMFTYPVFTVILEPLYIKTPFRLIQIPIALIAFAGIYILMPAFNFDNSNFLGIIIGTISAVLYAIRNIILKKHAMGINGLVVMTYQLGLVALLTLPLLFFVPIPYEEVKIHWYYIAFLGVVTTAMGHTFFVKSLNFFSAATISLLSNLTPVVGIIIGVILLNEKLTENIYMGGSLILFTALLEVIIGSRKK